MTERDLEEPVPDVMEQHQEAVPDEDTDEDTDEADQSGPEELPLEADEADVAEQAREVRLSEDDYR